MVNSGLGSSCLPSQGHVDRLGWEVLRNRVSALNLGKETKIVLEAPRTSHDNQVNLYGVLAMSLSLTPEIEQRIAHQLNRGRYQSADEVILAALELLDKREQYLAELRQKIEIGESQIQQGKVTDGELVFNRLLNRLQQQTEDS
ncbi:MAG: type II toxin-antitoxin system ParD family antitoxin [Coleofasciculus sp. G1-WW12-02]|uniref:type II toxin-antitoxin system ParD family antitoxin n=2 Tax=unclassified Coleofasciculus TaxID=2692782 RepID=UPI0032F1F1B0